MLTTILLAIVGASLLSFDATELPYFDPPESERTSLSYLYHGSGSIPLLLGEKLVTQNDPRLHATSLVVVVNQEYAFIQRADQSSHCSQVWNSKRTR
jgi:hypothetical protein